MHTFFYHCSMIPSISLRLLRLDNNMKLDYLSKLTSYSYTYLSKLEKSYYIYDNDIYSSIVESIGYTFKTDKSSLIDELDACYARAIANDVSKITFMLSTEKKNEYIESGLYLEYNLILLEIYRVLDRNSYKKLLKHIKPNMKFMPPSHCELINNLILLDNLDGITIPNSIDVVNIDDPRILFRQGIMYRQSKMYIESIELFSKASKIYTSLFIHNYAVICAISSLISKKLAGCDITIDKNLLLLSNNIENSLENIYKQQGKEVLLFALLFNIKRLGEDLISSKFFKTSDYTILEYAFSIYNDSNNFKIHESNTNNCLIATTMKKLRDFEQVSRTNITSLKTFLERPEHQEFRFLFAEIIGTNEEMIAW